MHATYFDSQRNSYSNGHDSMCNAKFKKNNVDKPIVTFLSYKK